MKTPPLDHHIPIFERIKDEASFALFMEYGTGKSYMYLWWLEDMVQRYHWRRGVLIVCQTKLNMINAWPEQIEEHSNFIYMILSDKSSKAKLQNLDNSQYLMNRPFIYLINYDAITHIYKDLINFKFDAILFDESTMIKNIRAKRTKRCLKLAATIPCQAIATGFPVTEDMEEIWSQYHVVDRENLLGETYWKFLKRHFIPYRFGWSLKRGHKQHITELIKRRSIFLRLRDCLNLPPRKNQYIGVEATHDQKKFLRELKEKFALELPGHERLEYKHILPTLVKSKQICSGFIYLNGEVFMRFPTAKDEILLNVCSNISSKAIIWCQYQAEINHLKLLLSQAFGREKVRAIESSLGIDEQKKIIRRFKDPEDEPQFLVSTYALLESGETLTIANYNIHYSHIESNAVTTNAKRRTYRKGSEIHDRIYYIHIYVKDTIEEVILKAQQKKRTVQNEIKKFMDDWRNDE